jgi:hypothetical protein
MTIVFLSNFFNHHQSAVSDALWTLSGGNYTFVEACEIPDARKQLGYSVLKKEYVISIQGNEEKVKQLVREADVVISGSAPGFLARERIKIGKPLFRYSERPLKNGLELYKYIPRLVLWHWRNPFWKPIYLYAPVHIQPRITGNSDCSEIKYINGVIFRKQNSIPIWKR